MNLYEFTFIAQQSLLQQEVEGMVQELAVLLKNIKTELILQEIKSFIDQVKQNITNTQENSVPETSVTQELEVCFKKIQKELVVYSGVLEKIVKILWADLQEDLSNLKEVKSQIERELQGISEEMKVVPTIQKLLKGSQQSTKGMIINNVISALKENVLEYINFQDVLKSVEVKQHHQLNRALEKLLSNIQASGLIKYEHWGLLDFAYPINKMKSGHYCILCVSSTPNIMDEFVRKVKLNENVVRYLSVQVDKIFEGKSRMMNKHTEE